MNRYSIELFTYHRCNTHTRCEKAFNKYIYNDRTIILPGAKLAKHANEIQTSVMANAVCRQSRKPNNNNDNAAPNAPRICII